MTVILKLPYFTIRLCLLEPDFPFAFFLVPVAAYNRSIEVHVFTQIERVADFVKVGPDVGRVAEKARPVGVLQCH